MSTLAIIQINSKVHSGFRQNMLLKQAEMQLLAQEVELFGF